MSILTDAYAQQIAKSRASYSVNNARSNALGKNLKSGNITPDNGIGDSLGNSAGKWLGKKAYNYIFNSPTETYGSYNTPYTADMPIPSNVEYSGGNYAPADVNSYYSDMGVTGSGESSGGSGVGTAMSALAIIEGALAIRGQSSTKDAQGRTTEKPWDEKTAQEKTTSAPLSSSILPFAYWMGNALNQSGYEDNPMYVGMNNVQQIEYAGMTPLYDFFIKGPQQSSADIRSNSFYGWGD